MILWRRGFFGKGNLSRSEPSWLSRQLNIMKAAGKRMSSKRSLSNQCLTRGIQNFFTLGRSDSTSEEVTARRRAERKQFKLDRARAIAAVAQEAEERFEKEGIVTTPALSGPAIPSGATWKPSQPIQLAAPVSAGDLDLDDSEDAEPEELENVEHLQLTLQEALFLAWNLDCLTVLHPDSVRAISHRQRNCKLNRQSQLEPMSLHALWTSFQRAHLPISIDTPQDLQFDNPFLINYVVYHHYRSLGWVVKGGIKFCVDYLLYKRGPVFSHAEFVSASYPTFLVTHHYSHFFRFALVVMPVYEDEQDQEQTITKPQNTEPFAWSWLSTINRVNSQVQKVSHSAMFPLSP